MTTVHVLNGPNLGRLGTREPDIYGTNSYADLVDLCEQTALELGQVVLIQQTDDEATLVGWLHAAADAGAPVVINPAAFTHYSYAVRDAVAMLSTPVVEVHLSNLAAREEFRQTSVVSAVARGVISGFGIDSYRLALHAISRMGTE